MLTGHKICDIYRNMNIKIEQEGIDFTKPALIMTGLALVSVVSLIVVAIGVYQLIKFIF